MTRSRRRIARTSLLGAPWIGLFVGVLAACSGAPGDELVADDELDQEAYAATAPTWINPECGEAGLLPPPGVDACDGPWTYQEQLWCTGVHPSCPDVCVDYDECSRWENGVTTGSVVVKKPTSTRKRTCTTRCSLMADGECTTTCSPQQPFGSAWCSQYAPGYETAAEDQAVMAINAETTMTATTKNQRISEAKAIAKAVHRITVTTTESTTKTGKFIIEKETATYTCNIDVTHAAPVYGANDSCPGCDAWADTSCTYACGVEPRVTAPGQIRPQSPNYSEIRCTTCEDQGIDAPGKYECLSQSLAGPAPATVGAIDFRSAIVARLKLLYELRGPSLPAAQQAAILALYADEDGAAACHGELGVGPSCLEVGQGAFNGSLLACQNLTIPEHAPLSVVSARMGDCLALFDQVAALEDGLCKDEYRTAVSTMARGLLERRMEGITYPAQTLSGLPEALAAIDGWYDHAVLVAGEDRAWLRADSSAIVGAFWRRVHALTSTLPPSVDASNVDATLDVLEQRGFAAEYAVLTAAFSSGAALDAPPLLALVADALRSSVQHLETVSEMHDLACRYRPCAPTSTTQSSQMWRLLASLHDPAALNAAVTAAGALGSAHADIRDAFANLAARHGRLAAAFAAAGGEGGLGALLADADLPVEAYELAVLIRLADLRWRNFQSTGLFLASEERALHAGMQNKTIVVQQLTGRVTSLANAYASFLGQRVSLVNALLADMQNNQDIRGFADRIEALNERLADATGELAGLRAREASERAAWSDYRAAFDEMSASGVFDAEAAANNDQLPSLTLRGDNARFTGTPAAPEVLTVLVGGSPWQRTMGAGQSLRLEVRGEWSPSCALQSNVADGIIGPTGQLYPVNGQDALIGPEGYRLQWTGSSFSASGENYAGTYTQAASVEACLRISTSVPGIVEFFTGVDAEAWVQACAQLAVSQSFQSTTSSGNDSRTAASFSGGLRLPNTPFPDAPAGALLLVVKEAGSAAVVDVQVVGRSFSYIAPGDVDLFLVVNDLSPTAPSATCVPRPQALTIDAWEVSSFGAIAGQLSIAMAQTLEALRAQAPAILAQGQLMPGEEALLRLQARQRVASLTGYDVTELPQAVQEFFDTWIAAELVSLNRRAQLHRREREIVLTHLDRRALVHELEAAGDRSRLHQLAPRWFLRQLETSSLAQEQRALLRYLRDYAPPILELRYPRALSDLLTSPDASVSAKVQLDALEALDFAAGNDDIVTLLLALGNKVGTSLDVAVADSHDYGVVRVAVSFPSPDLYEASGQGAEGCELFGTCGGNGAPPDTTWKPVEMTRAQLVWDALESGGVAAFTITPGDVYDSHGGVGQLTCSDAAPIIRKMAIYGVTTEGNDWGQIDYRPALQVGAEQVFPTATGTPMYVKTDADWLFTGVPFLGGVQNEALSDLRVHESAAASGLSPFNTFLVDFANYPVPDGQTEQLVVVFELETRPIAAPGVAIEACRP